MNCTVMLYLGGFVENDIFGKHFMWFLFCIFQECISLISYDHLAIWQLSSTRGGKAQWLNEGGPFS